MGWRGSAWVARSAMCSRTCLAPRPPHPAVGGGPAAALVGGAHGEGAGVDPHQFYGDATGEGRGVLAILRQGGEGEEEGHDDSYHWHAGAVPELYLKAVGVVTVYKSKAL